MTEMAASWAKVIRSSLDIEPDISNIIMISLGPDDAATYHGLLRLSYESQFDACLAGKILNTPL